MPLTELLEHIIAPRLPAQLHVREWHSALTTLFSEHGATFIVRGWGSQHRRGDLKISGDSSRYVMADNEPAAWVYERCLEGPPTYELMEALRTGGVPIRGGCQEWEKGHECWGQTSRVVRSIPEAWRLSHLFEAGRPNVSSDDARGLRIRALLLLSPFSYLPFPWAAWTDASRRAGEDRDVLDATIWFLAMRHYDAATGASFRQYLSANGLREIHPPGEDIRIVFERPDGPIKTAPKKDYDTETFISRREVCRTKPEFLSLLKRWYAESDEETIGVGYGGAPWVFLKLPQLTAQLHADTTRTSVSEFLRHASTNSVWRVRPSGVGKLARITSKPNGQSITRFAFYTRRSSETPDYI